MMNSHIVPPKLNLGCRCKFLSGGEGLRSVHHSCVECFLKLQRKEKEGSPRFANSLSLSPASSYMNAAPAGSRRPNSTQVSTSTTARLSELRVHAVHRTKCPEISTFKVSCTAAARCSQVHKLFHHVTQVWLLYCRKT